MLLKGKGKSQLDLYGVRVYILAGFGRTRYAQIQKENVHGCKRADDATSGLSLFESVSSFLYSIRPPTPIPIASRVQRFRVELWRNLGGL